jgi:hypothetical protein
LCVSTSRGNAAEFAAVEHVLFCHVEEEEGEKGEKRFFLESQTAFALKCDHPRST